MYQSCTFSRAKNLQLRRTVILCCACLVVLYFCFQEQISEKLCCSLTRPRSILSAKVWVTQSLEVYFCAPIHDHAVIAAEWNLLYHLGGNGPWIPKVDGFFGANWSTNYAAEVHIIPETPNRGADTLTPGITCLRYVEDKSFGHEQGYSKLDLWQDEFAKPIARRLLADSGGFAFSSLDIYSLMEICGFETLVRGESPWCDVFPREE